MNKPTPLTPEQREAFRQQALSALPADFTEEMTEFYTNLLDFCIAKGEEEGAFVDPEKELEAFSKMLNENFAAEDLGEGEG